MSQFERISYIDRKIRSVRGFVTCQEVADYFEVSTRQVKRDIEYLRERCNAPIIFDRAIRGYRYESEYKDLEFADQGVIISYLALQAFVKNKQYFPLYQDNLLKSISESVPKDYKEICEKISYQMPFADSIQSDFFEGICDSMRDSVCLDINYKNVKGEEKTRTIECLRLINYGGNWYILAFDHSVNDFRTFNISRIISVSISKEKFLSHDENFEKQIEKFMEGGFGIFHGLNTVIAKLKFYGNACQIVQNQQWHHLQKLEEGMEGNEKYIQMEFPVSDLTEVFHKLLSFGSSAKPVEPPELVKMWKDEIKKMGELTV